MTKLKAEQSRTTEERNIQKSRRVPTKSVQVMSLLAGAKTTD